MFKEFYRLGLQPPWLTAHHWYAAKENPKLLSNKEIVFLPGLEDKPMVPIFLNNEGQIKEKPAKPSTSLFSYWKCFVKVLRMVNTEDYGNPNARRLPDPAPYRQTCRRRLKRIGTTTVLLKDIFELLSRNAVLRITLDPLLRPSKTSSPWSGLFNGSPG